MAIEVLAPSAMVAGDGATVVSRTVPQPGHVGVGPWWFVDAFGFDGEVNPQGVRDSGPAAPPPAAPGEQVGAEEAADAARPAGAPHGHAGMQSMTWLFTGEMRHTDGLGTRADIGPGRVVMITAGDGIVHAEEPLGSVSPAGVALGLVLPPEQRHRAPSVEEFWPEPVRFGDHEVAIFVGELGWEDSPVEVFVPAAGAEVRFASHDPLELEVPQGWEFGVLALDAPVTVEGVEVPPGHLAVVGGQASLSVGADADAGRVVRALVLGGEIPEPFVPWWNFVGGDHDEIASWRASYEAARAGEPSAFALPPGVAPADLARAPELPPVRLLPKRRR